MAVSCSEKLLMRETNLGEWELEVDGRRAKLSWKDAKKDTSEIN